MPGRQVGPRILEIWTGVACPLNCRFCYRHGKDFERAGDLLEPSGLTDLLREFASGGGEEVYLSGGLEPLTRPHAAARVVGEAKRVGLRVQVYTNGVPPALAAGYLPGVLAREADQVRVSLPAATELTYREVTRPVAATATFARACGTVDRLLKLSKDSGNGARVGVSFLVVERNARELDAAARLWRDRGAAFLNVRVDAEGVLSCGAEVRDAIASLRHEANAGRYRPLEIDFFSGGVLSHAERCIAFHNKVTVDPFGLVFVCCRQAQPGARPDWAQVGDLRVERFGQVIQRLQTVPPLRHCARCTPYESWFNRQAQQGTATHQEPATEEKEVALRSAVWVPGQVNSNKPRVR